MTIRTSPSTSLGRPLYRWSEDQDESHSRKVTIAFSNRSKDYIGQDVYLAGTDTSLCPVSGLALKSVDMRLPGIITLGVGILHALAVAFILLLIQLHRLLKS